jgi:hypothetical protein
MTAGRGKYTCHRLRTETAAAGCRKSKAARTAFLDVVKLVKGCREKSEKTFRNLSE